MELLLQEITPILIAAIGTVLTYLLGKATAKLKVYLDEKGITEKIEQYKGLALVAVEAAEKIYGPGLGDKKKHLAKNYIINFVNSLGFVELTEEELDTFIEAAIIEMEQGWTGKGKNDK